MTDHADPGVDMLWEEFHRVVNMSSDELRSWLLTSASGEEGFRSSPDLGVAELGRRVLHVLAKRKGDLTSADVETMNRVVDLVEERRSGAPADAGGRDEWRRELMSVGHDPLRPSGFDSLE
ncbi:DUF3140 domain-containing protein [Thermostaphylospora chromogena]|uniref:DUF3140 domain-containing protein n=1 Tax=Thermostaphylospora chromogena TaxID=35622 RepID=A0A1H1GW22_9ACTN|nr:DUF3140 domain-containing protein [Thermostaphylospora chromogena]SDR17435.1 Protein of unknown function [Thermostaphylospora chromogena]